MDAWSPAHLLPGLYVGLLAAALWWVLRQWYDPIPARVMALFGLLLGLLFGPALTGGRVLLPLDTLRRHAAFRMYEPAPQRDHPLQTDLLFIITPAQAAVRRALAAGELPLWDPLTAGGMPLAANPVGQPLQPLALAALPFPLADAPGIIAGLRLLVGLCFTFLVLRRQGIGEAPAAAGGVAYGLGGGMMQWLGWPQANAMALLPALVYALLRAEEPGRRRDVLLLAAVGFSLLVSGHPETAVIALLAGGAWGLARLAGRPRGRRLGPFARWAGAGGLAAALAAPALLPMALYLPQTDRHFQLELLNADRRAAGVWGGWRTAEERAASLAAVEARWLPLAAPRAFGDQRFELYWGDLNSIEDAAGWAATAALLAALLAVAPGRGARRFPQERLALGLLLAVLVLLARPPGLEALIIRLPLVSSSSTLLHRAVMIWPFATAYLAACTWERWRHGELAPARVLGAGAALAGLLLWAHLGHPPPAPAGELAAVREATLAVHLLALAAATGLLLVRRPGRGAPWALAAVVAVEALVVQSPLNPPMPRGLFYPTPPSVAFLQRSLGDDRMVTMENALPANVGQIYRLGDLGSYDPLTPLPIWWIRETLQVARPPSAGGGRLDHPLLDFLGLRYVVTAPRRHLPGLRLAFRHYSGWVWERPRTLPRLFLARSARRIEPTREGDPSSAGRHLLGIEDPERVFLAAREGVPPGGVGGAWSPRRPGASTLRVLARAAGHWVAEADLVEPRLLATSVYQDGGWRVEVDGGRVPARTVNGFFVGAWLPPGRHRVELVYRPPGLLAGVALAAVGAAAAALWWGWAGARARRARE